MIIIVAVSLTVFYIFYALRSTSYKYPLVVFIVLSPIVAAAWNYRYLGLTLVDFFYSIFIILFLIRVLLRKEDISGFPYLKLIKFYFVLILFISTYIAANSGIIDSLDFLVKSLFMPIAFYLFSVHFTDSKSRKFLVSGLILSGLFPLFFILLEKFSGNVWFFRQTRGLTRYVGLYHDAAALDIFLIQALIGIMLFWHYFLRKRQILLRHILAALFILLLAGSYFLYTKTIFLTLGLWLLAFLFTKRRIALLASLMVLIILLNFISGQKIFSEVNQVFSKEVDLVQGNLSLDAAFSGRGGMWRKSLDYWSNLPFLEKILGAGKVFAGAHNDFIRMLLSGGLLLLIFSIFLFSTLILAAIKDYRKKNYFVHFTALLCIVYYFVVSLGRVPGLYPNVQIMTWGFIGLSLSMKSDWET